MVIHYGMGHAMGQSLGVLYTDHDLLGLQYTEWLQGGINVLIVLFHQNCLMDNVPNFKTMACHPGAVCSVMLGEAVGLQSRGKGAT